MWLRGACGVGVAVGVAGILLYTRRRRIPHQVAPPAVEGGRPLGCGESMILDMCDAGGGQTCRIFIVSSKHPVTKELVYQSLERLVAIHPSLRMQIMWLDGIPWMVPRESIAINLEEVQSADWKKVAEDELLVKFSSRAGEFWRVKILPKVSYPETSLTHPHQAALVLSFHHLISDGTGILLMFDDLLTILNDVMDGKETTIPPVERLPLSQEECLGVKPNTGILTAIKISLLSTVLRFQCIRVFLCTLIRNKFLDEFGPVNIKPILSEIKPCLITEEFSPTFAAKLLAACRANKCNVTHAVQAAASYAVALFWRQRGKKDTEVALHTLAPLGLRNKVIKGAAASYKLVNYVTGIEFDTKVKTQKFSMESFWQTARDTRDQITDFMKQKTYISNTKLAMDLNRMGFKLSTLLGDLWKRPVPKRHGFMNTVLVLNNMGNCSYFDRPIESSVRLLVCHQSAAAHKYGGVFINYIVSFEGKLFLTVNYCPHITSEKVAEQYVAALKENLQKATGSILVTNGEA